MESIVKTFELKILVIIEVTTLILILVILKRGQNLTVKTWDPRTDLLVLTVNGSPGRIKIWSFKFKIITCSIFVSSSVNVHTHDIISSSSFNNIKFRTPPCIGCVRLDAAMRRNHLRIGQAIWIVMVVIYTSTATRVRRTIGDFLKLFFQLELS